MKTLILGASGMLGHQMWVKCLETFGEANVGCTLRKPSKHFERFEIFKSGQIFDQVDATDFEQICGVLENFKPQIIINCIGLTLRKPDLKDIEKCIEVNSMLPHRLAIWGQANGAKVIHFSTDCVFDGKKGPYKEADIPSALDLYGKSKFLGEISYENALTLRLSIVGRELEGKTELIEWFLSQKSKDIKGFSEVWYSGLTTNFVANEVIKLIKTHPKLHGVYQVSSEPITKYDLLDRLNKIFSVKASIAKDPTYKSNKVLKCDRYALATGFKKPTWDEMLQDLFANKNINYE